MRIRQSGFLAVFVCLSALAGAAPDRLAVLAFSGIESDALLDAIDGGEAHAFRAAFGKSQPIEITSKSSSPPEMWATFATALPPALHGVTGWVDESGEASWTRIPPPRVDPKTGRIDIRRPRSRMRTEPFWERLAANGVKVALFQIPFCYPPTESNRVTALAGVGTPHLRHGAAPIVYLSNDPRLIEGEEDFAIRIPLQFENDRATASLPGPWIPQSYAASAALREERRRRKDRLESYAPGDANTVRSAIARLERQMSALQPARFAHLPLTVDRSSERIVLQLGDRSLPVHDHGWTDWATASFSLDEEHAIDAVLRFAGRERVIRAGSRIVARFVDILCAPLTSSPLAPALPLSWPPSEAVEAGNAASPAIPWRPDHWAWLQDSLERGWIDERTSAFYMQERLQTRQSAMAQSLSSDDWRLWIGAIAQPVSAESCNRIFEHARIAAGSNVEWIVWISPGENAGALLSNLPIDATKLSVLELSRMLENSG